MTLKPLFVSAALGMLCLGSACGEKATELPTVPAQRPINLANEVETVATNSWTAMPIEIPYKCSLAISADVVRGNSLTMMLTNSKGIQRLKTHKSGSYVGEFYAPHTITFRHTGRVNQGTYYFVMRDKHLGEPFSSSDISVKASIEP
jgi:hypothetical protein